MAGCNDDIILRKDNVICDKGSGISLKDFVNKLIAQYLAENPSTGGSGGSSASTSLFVSASDQSGTAGEITLPNSGQPLIIKSTRSDIAVTRSGNQIIIGNPPAACTPVASPTIATFTLDVSELEIGTNKTTFVPTFTTTTPSGSPSSTPGVEPCAATQASSWTSFQVVATPPSGGNQTFSNVTSGVSRNFTTALTFTAPGQTCTFTLTGTGLKSDGTSATASATATITAKFKVFSGYVLASTSPGSITTFSLTASSLKTSISGTYGNSGHPGTGTCYFYFAIPATFNLTTALLGTNGFSFLASSDSGNGYITSDSYNNGDATTYVKTITYNGINYYLYRSNNSTLAAFGNISIT
jgi:hypothetical protein